MSLIFIGFIDFMPEKFRRITTCFLFLMHSHSFQLARVKSSTDEKSILRYFHVKPQFRSKTPLVAHSLLRCNNSGQKGAGAEYFLCFHTPRVGTRGIWAPQRNKSPTSSKETFCHPPSPSRRIPGSSFATHRHHRRKNDISRFRNLQRQTRRT